MEITDIRWTRECRNFENFGKFEDTSNMAIKTKVRADKDFLKNRGKSRMEDHLCLPGDFSFTLISKVDGFQPFQVSAVGELIASLIDLSKHNVSTNGKVEIGLHTKLSGRNSTKRCVAKLQWFSFSFLHRFVRQIMEFEQ